MKNVKIDLENCYGIKKLSYTFDFTSNRTYAVYAANGSMKTSFANTFLDHSQKKESHDLVFPERETKREILENSTKNLDPEKVFVIEPYNQEYSSDRTSTLLVNKTLKKKFDDIWSEIQTLESELIKSLKKPSGLSKGIDDEISQTVMSTTGKFIDSLLRLKKEVLDDKDPVLDKVDYKVIFNDKVLKFLDDNTVRSDLEDYITRYDELIEKSKFFRKGIFNHTNASAIAKTLVANGFFDASHTVSFSDEINATKSEINSKEDLEKIIQAEMEEILSDQKLLEAFQKIDKKLTNEQLKTFREYIAEHKDLIPELANLGYLKNKLWVDYLKVCKETYTKLIEVYEKAEKDLKEIQEQANKERTRWAEVVDTFNKRFSVPFVLRVENQGDVMLKSILPVLEFEFIDGEDKRIVDRGDLLKVLSNGEKKALYILNLLFEIEARKNANMETLLVIDDIADSFDYKNKYAIIEYLRDNIENENFYQIILTHNFDFFRTVESKFVNYKCCLMVDREENELKLISAEYIKNPFKDFVKNTNNNSKFLALIPFMRNLVEYTKGESDPQFETLTAVLHRKSNTDSITKKDINDIINDLFPNESVTLNDPKAIVSDLFVAVADDLAKQSESLRLENKIVLSVAIRLKAEDFMINKISDKDYVQSITHNQTACLIDKYIEEQPKEEDNIQILKRVSLVTPQNIHINSFMYEPILDMSDVELKDLYNDMSKLK